MSDRFVAGQQEDAQQDEWTYTTIMDSSRVSTCLISMLLIVYGSFRSLNMEQEQREKEKKQQSESMNNLITGEPVQQGQCNFQLA
jgi:signal peptide peptidase-like protein 3